MTEQYHQLKQFPDGIKCKDCFSTTHWLILGTSVLTQQNTLSADLNPHRKHEKEGNKDLTICSCYWFSRSFPVILIAVALIFSCNEGSKDRKAESSYYSGDSGSVEKNVPESDKSADASIREELPDALKRKDLPDADYRISAAPNEYLAMTEGGLVASSSFSDANGKNHILITETSPVNSGEWTSEKRLYGYHFIEGKDPELLWKINDFIRDCEVDVTLEFIENSLSITDLDADGIFESSFLYKMSCKGDVSPDEMKLIMHEGAAKYAIRGVMDLDVGGYGMEKGSMKVDASFNTAPDAFRDYAIERWNKFKLERIGN